MSPRLAGTIIIQTFGRELARLRNHPELAWAKAWDLTADDSLLDTHDELKEIAFGVFGIAHKLRLKSRFLPPMGATPPELFGQWYDPRSGTLH